MLNVFPALLDFRFFAPTLLRLAAGLVFLFIAYRQWQHRKQISRISYFIVGSGSWIVFASVLWEGITGAGLTLGLYTQIAALLGLISAIKYIIWQRRYPEIVVLERPASFLLFIVCLSLILTGAGALAFDVPL